MTLDRPDLRVGMLGRTGCLCSDQLYVESVREPTGDLVLKGEQIGRVAVKTLCP